MSSGHLCMLSSAIMSQPHSCLTGTIKVSCQTSVCWACCCPTAAALLSPWLNDSNRLRCEKDRRTASNRKQISLLYSNISIINNLKLSEAKCARRHSFKLHARASKMDDRVRVWAGVKCALAISYISHGTR